MAGVMKAMVDVRCDVDVAVSRSRVVGCGILF